MTIATSGRSALILAAGLWLCVAGPMHATESDASPADSSAKADGATGKPIALNKFAKPHHTRKTAKAAKPDKAAKAAATTNSDAKNVENAKSVDTNSTNPMPPRSPTPTLSCPRMHRPKRPSPYRPRPTACSRASVAPPP
ncbi:hypothetical protein ONR75_22705 [Rhodopseudomonas sp. P2A-2r]|uniref:hypothetical protein n=1 Tax=Rhodopseudomonas sp. P2A-2r TaxID=2991972 RepID=UPI0022348B8E|nr:hypothetical protein [Rhodopseudomonas sp. P2A-2r]UZE47683.1 hypothetical protein ONR75_22705 [Rhodopseudomonas sp. P2A-2r]